MTLSTQLKLYREQSGLSQAIVAEKLNISRQSVSKWENGHSYPDIDNLILLSNLYQVSIDELLRENEQLKMQIQKNTSEIKDKQKKLDFINQTTQSEKDESFFLILLAGLSSFIFPIGLVLVIFVFWRNKRSNRFYKLIYFICILALLLNIYDGYVHLSNYLDWGTGTVERIE